MRSHVLTSLYGFDSLRRERSLARLGVLIGMLTICGFTARRRSPRSKRWVTLHASRPVMWLRWHPWQGARWAGTTWSASPAVSGAATSSGTFPMPPEAEWRYVAEPIDDGRPPRSRAYLPRHGEKHGRDLQGDSAARRRRSRPYSEVGPAAVRRLRGCMRQRTLRQDA